MKIPCEQWNRDNHCGAAHNCASCSVYMNPHNVLHCTLLRYGYIGGGFEGFAQEGNHSDSTERASQEWPRLYRNIDVPQKCEREYMDRTCIERSQSRAQRSTLKTADITGTTVGINTLFEGCFHSGMGEADAARSMWMLTVPKGGWHVCAICEPGEQARTFRRRDELPIGTG